MKFTLQHRQVLEGIPSASGIEIIDGKLFVIGDNSAWLYELNPDYSVTKKRLLMDGVTDSILPKAFKPDFEAMTSIEVHDKKELLIFGSGSKSPERDWLVRLSSNEDDQPMAYSLTALYDALKTSVTMDASTLNIEAAAVVGIHLYLLNRETNTLIVYPLVDFLNALDTSGPFPEAELYTINLPKLNGHQVKFSGAATVDGTQQLLFTASVEDTPNTYDDGEVLGSYLGVIDVSGLTDHCQPKYIAIQDREGHIPIKVESVEVLKSLGPHHVELVMVTDSDGGDSELLVGELEW